MNRLETLRGVVNNEALPVSERRDAAEHLIRTLVESVTLPGADDPEVIELRKPWSDPFLAQMGAEVTNGYSLTGHPLRTAIETVHRRHRLRAVLAVVVDEAAHRMERLAACQSILDEAHPEGHWRRNNYSAERLLEYVKTPEGVDYWGRQWQPGARPPREIGDVWGL